jgi:hypothetical protein
MLDDESYLSNLSTQPGGTQRSGDPNAIPELSGLGSGIWALREGCVPAMFAPDLSRLRSHYTADPSTFPEAVDRHVDFEVKDRSYSVFRLTDWSWEDHGVGLISKYLGHELGEMLDETFEEAQHMTDGSLFARPHSATSDTPSCPEVQVEPVDLESSNLGASNTPGRPGASPSPSEPESQGAYGIDTAPFRQAIWYYVLRLFGQSHDDYDYSLVNHFVNKRTKAFIKKVAVSPHTLAFRDFMRVGVLLRPEEKVHVNILVIEARKQAELVWALSAIVKYLDRSRS